MLSEPKRRTGTHFPKSRRNPGNALKRPSLRWERQIHPGWPADKKRLGDGGRGDTIDPFDLSGRIALVTGAGRGIGRAVAQRLAVLGAHVIITDINTDGAKETKAIIDNAGGGAEVQRLDVTDDAEISRVAEAVIAAHGRIDILINNAGICINATALDTSDEIWRRQMSVNIDAVFRCCREFGAHMFRRRKGAIVNLSSFAAVVDVRPQNHVAYSVSKAGVAHMSRVLASEWAHRGVRVNAVAPGIVATDMPLGAGVKMHKIWKTQIPTGQFLQPYEIANVIAFLVSDASSAITGHLIMADGGVTIW